MFLAFYFAAFELDTTIGISNILQILVFLGVAYSAWLEIRHRLTQADAHTKQQHQDLREVKQELRAMSDRIGELILTNSNLNTSDAHITRRVDDHEQRLRAIENEIGGRHR